MLNLTQLSELVNSAQRSIFRLEAQPSYDVTAADRDVARYLAGEEPDMERKQKWLDVLRARVARGVTLHHVRVLRLPPSDYDRMVCEWGYPNYVRVGQQVRVLPVLGPETESWSRDFYLLDDKTVVLLSYDDVGRFTGAEIDASMPIRPWQRVATNTWEQATSFTEWWADHPEYHRRAAVQ